MPSNRFQFTLSSLHNSKSGYISLGDENIHHIGDTHEFYKALGYTDDVMKSGLLPEEFIWSEFHKDNCKKSEVCLQVKIIEYLNKHSATFKDKYAEQCKIWLASCLEKWTSNAAECKNCEKPKLIIGFPHPN